MDRKQRKRIIIFLLVPFLATILFLSEDLIIRIIIAAVLVVYVAFIIFLRDVNIYSTEHQREEENENEDISSVRSIPDTDFNESFEIVSKNKNLEVITADNYTPENR